MIPSLRTTFVLVSPRVAVDVMESDPDDNRILEAALQADAQVIVSGDHHLLALGTWRDIRILSPADFLRNPQRVCRDESGLNCRG